MKTISRQMDFDALFEKMKENSARMLDAWNLERDLPEFEGTFMREFPMLSRTDTIDLFGYDGMLVMVYADRYGTDFWFAALCDDVDDIGRLEDITNGSGDHFERMLVEDLILEGDRKFTIAADRSPTGALKSLAEKNANKAPGYPIPFGYLMMAACSVARGMSWEEAMSKTTQKA